MIKINTVHLVLILCLSISQTCTAHNTDHITIDCKEEVNPTHNPIEQFMDFLSKRGYGIDVETPDRDVALVQISKEDGEISHLSFEIPHRIDMREEYSSDIDKAVNTRNELPFAAFRILRSAPIDETVDIGLNDWTLYNVRAVDAGKYGYLLCYNKNKRNQRDVACMTMNYFASCLKFYKANRHTSDAHKESTQKA